MHGYWSRVSQLISVYIFALFVCGAWTYAGGKFQELSSTTDKHLLTPIKRLEVSRFGGHYLYHVMRGITDQCRHEKQHVAVHVLVRSDVAEIKLTMDVDLRDAFTWSTDILFVYLSLGYPTSLRPRNEVVIWDRIIRSKEEAQFTINEGLSKYHFQEYSKGHVYNKTIVGDLHYYQMPKTGFFHVSLSRC
ncbi:signal peptidase [Gregarina niphandrodes]|uniref:Signal peptidase complex subunit 3 n=1 Tax=Gregarina niphandrodes TaxID=110365 RepID=A0A023B4B9_GRENI|nr:signal peptidase [Gregarina niphandrodes]EZG56139.1 signal peptidase [Gregarina niphandrodes]|eukprot:XP_011131312.1 signal peptidase [Gregarina niphandrodes]